MDKEDEKNKMRETKRPARSADQELEEAVGRVYQQYGPDLSEFVKEVQKDIQKRSASACSVEYKFLSL
jgi:hypothetical protein